MKDEKYPLWNRDKTIGSDDLQISYKPAKSQITIEILEAQKTEANISLPFDEKLMELSTENNDELG